MHTLRKLMLLTLLFALATTSIQAQEESYSPNLYETPDENYGNAYQQSSRAAHWSAYVPLTVLIVAAIFFGLADRNHHHNHHYSSSGSSSHYGSRSYYSSYPNYDGLGSLGSVNHYSNYSY